MPSILARARNARIKILKKLFEHTLGRMNYYQSWDDRINVIRDPNGEIIKILEEKSKEESHPKLLDIGAREGEKKIFSKGYEYYGIDIEPKNENIIRADICHCPQIEDNTFDAIISFDVFEHLERPWDAASECVRILKPGGIMVHRTLFAYRYHPCPIDYWRFSSEGLEYLFNRTGKMETLLKGYDLKIRRKDKRGEMPGEIPSKPPIDYLGGFRENWRTLYIGRKKQAEN